MVKLEEESEGWRGERGRDGGGEREGWRGERGRDGGGREGGMEGGESEGWRGERERDGGGRERGKEGEERGKGEEDIGEREGIRLTHRQHSIEEMGDQRCSALHCVFRLSQ